MMYNVGRVNIFQAAQSLVYQWLEMAIAQMLARINLLYEMNRGINVAGRFLQ